MIKSIVDTASEADETGDEDMNEETGATEKLNAPLRTLTRVVITGMCLLGLDALLTWVFGNWAQLPSSKHTAIVTLLMIYPLPCVHLWVKRQDTLAYGSAALTYIAFASFQALLSR